MQLPPFLLDHWLSAYQFADPPIRFDLAASTGPKWTLGELAKLGQGLDVSGTALGYSLPQGSRALREALGRFLDVDPDWVVVTTGASEALSILYCLAARPGADVLLPSPAFPAFEAMAGVWQLGVRHYELDPTDGFRHAPAAIVDAAGPDTVLALINTPHNPTGVVVSPDEIAAMAAGLARRNVPLIVDEVYHPLYFGESGNPTAAGMDNVIVLGDMSKALSLAGLRLGWLVEPDAERRRQAIEARSYFTISGSPLLERLAAHALENSGLVLGRLADVARRNLALLSDFMEREADTLAWVKPGGGTVCYPWFRDGRDSRPFCRALAEAGVLVAPGDCFGQPSHMRIGFAAQADGFAEALSIVSTILTSRPTRSAGL